MKNAMSRLAINAALACMVFAPIAAQAKTRAGDSGVVYSQSAISQPGMGRSVDGMNIANPDEDEAAGVLRVLLAIFGGAAVIAALISIDDEDDQSPGT